MGLYIPHSIDTEIPEEDAVWRGVAGTVGDNQGTAPIQKDRGGGRRDVRRPHTPEREDSAEGGVSNVMGYVKGKSALALFDRHPEWRRRFGMDRTLWARGYYVSTVGLNEGAVRKYIREQENADRMTDE